MFKSGNMNGDEKNSSLMIYSFYDGVKASVENTTSLSSYLCKKKRDPYYPR